jgi:hypothetical protein
MKHILNNLTEQEKNAIREQHTGGMKVMTEKFSQLIESKLGDVKPYLMEQSSKNWLDVVKFVKSNGLKGYAFKSGIEGDERLGIELTNPKDKTLYMRVEPDKTFTMSKKQPDGNSGYSVDKGTWSWDGKSLTLVSEKLKK